MRVRRDNAKLSVATRTTEHVRWDVDAVVVVNDAFAKPVGCFAREADNCLRLASTKVDTKAEAIEDGNNASEHDRNRAIKLTGGARGDEVDLIINKRDFNCRLVRV